MSNIIRHLGVVDTVGNNRIKVRIIQASACSSCKMSGNCSASESKEKIVDVYEDKPYNFKKGDRVVVIASQRMGFLAVFLSSVIPLLIVISVLAVVFIITKDELVSALSCLCSLLPYYIILYCFREKLRAKFSFYIDPMSINRLVGE